MHSFAGTTNNVPVKALYELAWRLASPVLTTSGVQEWEFAQRVAVDTERAGPTAGDSSHIGPIHGAKTAPA